MFSSDSCPFGLMGHSTLPHLQCAFESQVILVGKPLPPLTLQPLLREGWNRLASNSQSFRLIYLSAMIIDTHYHTQLLSACFKIESITHSSIAKVFSPHYQCWSVLMKNEPQATANSTSQWHRPRYHIFCAMRKTRPIWWRCLSQLSSLTPKS